MLLLVIYIKTTLNE